MNTDELQRILKLTQQGHGVGMTTKFWTQLENLLKQRDAALKLTQYAIYRDKLASWMIVKESKMFNQCIKDRGGPYIEYDALRAIFEEKP